MLVVVMVIIMVMMKEMIMMVLMMMRGGVIRLVVVLVVMVMFMMMIMVVVGMKMITTQPLWPRRPHSEQLSEPIPQRSGFPRKSTKHLIIYIFANFFLSESEHHPPQKYKSTTNLKVYSWKNVNIITPQKYYIYVQIDS